MAKSGRGRKLAIARVLLRDLEDLVEGEKWTLDAARLAEWRRVLLDAAGRRGRDQINMMIFDLIDFGPRWDFAACVAGLTALAKSMKKI